jgi:shikimate kinase
MNHSEATPKNIVLIGFMGSGKSTIGRELHQRLGYQLMDFDQMIEEKLGKKITEIFRDEGETFFRDLETQLLTEIAQITGVRHIISTGGGVVVRPENRELLHKLGYVVWLNAKPNVIYERTSRNRERPLLQTENPRESIKQLMELREPWYRETAHLTVDTSGLESHEIAAGILESARYFFTHLE